MTSVCQGLSSLAGGGKMRDPGNEVGLKLVTLVNEHSFLSKYDNWECEGLTNRGICNELRFTMSFPTPRIAAVTVNPHMLL